MNISYQKYDKIKNMFACTTSAMLVILFIMKYHSVLPAVIALSNFVIAFEEIILNDLPLKGGVNNLKRLRA